MLSLLESFRKTESSKNDASESVITTEHTSSATTTEGSAVTEQLAVLGDDALDVVAETA